MTGKRDISDEIEFKNGRGNPFGWSVREIHHEGRRIGEFYCGYPQNFIPGYSFVVTDEGQNTERTIICKHEIELTLPEKK